MFLAEDDENIRVISEDVLESAGYLVLSARDGEEALLRMRGTHGPAVAVIDLMMPYMDGLSLIAAMRADEELVRIPVIAMSAQRDAPKAPIDHFMRKPFGPDELVNAVSAYCR